jgi:chemotaxis signal transduction protein
MKFDVLNRLPCTSVDDAERKLVQFSAGHVRLGADIMRVREILNPQEMIPVPAAPRFVVGATDHRDAMIPVLDLCMRLGLEHSGEGKPKWVVVAAGGTDIALLVDAVIGVTSVSRAMERERHPLMEGPGESWFGAVYSVGGALVFELDLDSVAGVDKDLLEAIAPAKGPR